MEIINESFLINRDNVLEFLSAILSDKPMDEKAKKEFLEKFNRIVKYNSNSQNA